MASGAPAPPQDVLSLVGLPELMRRTRGDRRIVIGLVDGPVDLDHPDLDGGTGGQVDGIAAAMCSHTDSAACRHGTCVAGILCGRRGSVAPAIAPGCTLHVRPVFTEAPGGRADATPWASEADLAHAVRQSVTDGARLINLSLSMAPGWSSGRGPLMDAVASAQANGVLVIAAAGNDAALASSPLTAHPWVIPVVATDRAGRPLPNANLSARIARRGLRAPGVPVTSLGPEPGGQVMGGSSVSAALVTGAAALLWSLRPAMSAVEVRELLAPTRTRARSIVPPALDASRASRRVAPMSTTTPLRAPELANR